MKRSDFYVLIGVGQQQQQQFFHEFHYLMKTKLPWFSHLLRHSARWAYSTTLRSPHGGVNVLNIT